MNEARFVNQNKDQWDKYTLMADTPNLYSPTELGEAYLRLCSDLAFAQSHYPGTQVEEYLNSLALQFHHILYRRQPQRWRELWHFFSRDVPRSFYESRHYLVFALVLMLLGEALGVLSQHLDPEFFERFFGYGYAQMTRNNIENGNPMGVYDSPNAWEMFWGIVLNNVMVGLRVFVDGLLTPFYVIYVTLMNGVMMGCFDMFFAQQGYLVDALVAPNEHGALELPAIIICSAAGIQLGMGWFFPGKKTRLQALRATALRSVTMTLATIPVFAVAAFIESFVTRHQEWPLSMRIVIVAAGLAFIVYYCVVTPSRPPRGEERKE